MTMWFKFFQLTSILLGVMLCNEAHVLPSLHPDSYSGGYQIAAILIALIIEFIHMNVAKRFIAAHAFEFQWLKGYLKTVIKHVYSVLTFIIYFFASWYGLHFINEYHLTTPVFHQEFTATSAYYHYKRHSGNKHYHLVFTSPDFKDIIIGDQEFIHHINEGDRVDVVMQKGRLGTYVLLKLSSVKNDRTLNF
jgi:hypothetical protein